MLVRAQFHCVDLVALGLQLAPAIPAASVQQMPRCLMIYTTLGFVQSFHFCSRFVFVPVVNDCALAKTATFITANYRSVLFWGKPSYDIYDPSFWQFSNVNLLWQFEENAWDSMGFFHVWCQAQRGAFISIPFFPSLGLRTPQIVTRFSEYSSGNGNFPRFPPEDGPNSTQGDKVTRGDGEKTFLWKLCLIVEGKSESIWGGPRALGLPPVIIHFRLGFSTRNHPAIGDLPFQETSISGSEKIPNSNGSNHDSRTIDHAMAHLGLHFPMFKESQARCWSLVSQKHQRHMNIGIQMIQLTPESTNSDANWPKTIQT